MSAGPAPVPTRRPRRVGAALGRSLALPAAVALIAAVPGAALAAPTPPPAPATTLVSRAVLPADTFAPGPPSGAYISDPKRATPFKSQPVQGFSAYVDLKDGTGDLLAMPDNGYGSQENSADFLERVYRVHLTPHTAAGGSGAVQVLSQVTLSDPNRLMPYSIVHEFTDRRLTGSDIDLESMQVAPDGSWWFGEEFGPFLLHTDAQGRLLDAPYPLPDVRNSGQQVISRQNGGLEESASERIMQALRDRAQSQQDSKPLVVSPDFHLLADGDPTVGLASRQVHPRLASPRPAARSSTRRRCCRPASPPSPTR